MAGVSIIVLCLEIVRHRGLAALGAFDGSDEPLELCFLLLLLCNGVAVSHGSRMSSVGEDEVTSQVKYTLCLGRHSIVNER